jgi:hypothetical protein
LQEALMDRRDEIWLPDGRVVPYRRVHEPPVRRRACGGLATPRREPSVDRRRRARPSGERGRHLDLLV